MILKVRASLVLATLLVGGCSSYTQTVPIAAIPERPATDRRFQVWTRGEHYELHALRITADTVAGVRFFHHPTCDSCRVSFPRAEVDSIRTLEFDGGETGVLVIVATPVVLFLGLWGLVLLSGGRLMD